MGAAKIRRLAPERSTPERSGVDEQGDSALSFLTAKQKAEYAFVIGEYLDTYPPSTTDCAAVQLLSSTTRSGRANAMLVRAKLREWLGMGRTHTMIVSALVIASLSAQGPVLPYANRIMENWEKPLQHKHYNKRPEQRTFTTDQRPSGKNTFWKE